MHQSPVVLGPSSATSKRRKVLPALSPGARLSGLAPPPLGRPAERELRTQEGFQESVRRERVRADRTGDELSLATIRLGSPGRGADPGLQHALDSILGRVRCLDEVGWLRPGILGLLLPATTVLGAQKLVEDLRRNDTTGHLRHGRWVLYAYPEAWIWEKEEGDAQEDNGHSGNGHSGNGHSGNGHSGNGHSGNGHSKGTSSNPRRSISRPSCPDPLPSACAEVRSLVDLLELPLPPWKRTLDVVGSVLGLVLLSPLMLLAALGIKLTSRGPVFYTSWRSGVRGRPFRFLKFRTMYADAEERKTELLEHNEVSGPVFKMAEDPRITPLGRLLRKTSIDELPQLWNVLKGEMSLVGPRPPIPEETRFYAPWQRRRLEGQGGLTCIWQVAGRSNVQFADWVRMDIRYLKERSLWMDLLILLQTIPAVFSCRGAR